MDTVKYSYVSKIRSRYGMKGKTAKGLHIRKTPHQLSETMYKKKNYGLLVNYNPKKYKSMENMMMPILDYLLRDSYAQYTMYLRNKKIAYYYKGIRHAW